MDTPNQTATRLLAARAKLDAAQADERKERENVKRQELILVEARDYHRAAKARTASAAAAHQQAEQEHTNASETGGTKQ